MEYTLFQDFARKIPRPTPPTGHPGPAQSGRTPEFGKGPLNFWSQHMDYLYDMFSCCPSSDVIDFQGQD